MLLRISELLIRNYFVLSSTGRIQGEECRSLISLISFVLSCKFYCEFLEINELELELELKIKGIPRKCRVPVKNCLN